MSDPIKHECGIALIRLLKPLDYYVQKYGTVLYGFNKLFLLLEKQHNRGQDGVGIGAVKLDVPAGEAFMFRERDNGKNPLNTVISKQIKAFNKAVEHGDINPEDAQSVKKYWDFGAELLIGHLRYGTSGGYSKNVCQPYFRKSPWPTRNLMLAGNFNLTNVDELNAKLIARGAHPIFDTDTQTMLEEIGYHLDEEHTRIYHEIRNKGWAPEKIPQTISERLDPAEIVREAARDWDGGYTLAGLIGNGDCFVLRDPVGIRPGYYFQDDEIIAFASERVALMTIFDREEEEISEIEPGSVVVVKANGHMYTTQFKESKIRSSCSFERIYFSRGNDPQIYRERKALGAALAKPILKAIDNDLANSVFSFIPNTAETAYYGLMDELRILRRKEVKEKIMEALDDGKLTEALLDELIMDNWPRGEKIAHKDIKLRTFISNEKNRIQLASHVYDITYGQVGPGMNLVCVDDSIVRGTTLRQSILRILGRTRPKKIIIASTAPQIRYPDCYGIDMSELSKFVAFQAAIALCEETGQKDLVREVYEDCCAQKDKPAVEMVNHVKRIYDAFSADAISAKIAELVYPNKGDWKGELQIIYQDIESLHKSCPNNHGDWYFTGNYPTPGGFKVLNRAFIYYYEKRDGRSY